MCVIRDSNTTLRFICFRHVPIDVRFSYHYATCSVFASLVLVNVYVFFSLPRIMAGFGLVTSLGSIACLLTTGYGYYIVGQFFLSTLFFLTIGPWNSVVMWTFIHPILDTARRKSAIPVVKKILVGVFIMSFVLEYSLFIFIWMYASQLETFPTLLPV